LVQKINIRVSVALHHLVQSSPEG
jgi:hypothetical protein